MPVVSPVVSVVFHRVLVDDDPVSSLAGTLQQVSPDMPCGGSTSKGHHVSPSKDGSKWKQELIFLVQIISYFSYYHIMI